MLALAADDKTRKQRQESMGEEGRGQAGPNSDETDHSPALPLARAARTLAQQTQRPSAATRTNTTKRKGEDDGKQLRAAGKVVANRTTK